MRKKLIYSILVGFICLTLFGCGKKDNNIMNNKDSDPKINESIMVSEYTNIDDYKEETIKKMQSLGKSIKDKILIILEDSRTQTTYHVLVFEDGKNIENLYYYFYLKNTANFESISKGYEEVDNEALWIKTSVDVLDRTWQQLYKSFSHMRGYTIVE